MALDLGADGEALTTGSRLALRRGLWLAEDAGARLTLVHAQVADEYWDEGAQVFRAAAPGQVDRVAVLEEAAQEARARGVECAVRIRHESAWLAIIREVLHTGADILIAAKRTEASSDGRRLGAVARKLVHNAPCAVWLEDPRQPRDPRCILAATDLSPVGDRVVALAATLAHALSATLHVVHATTRPLGVQFDDAESRVNHERRMREAAETQIRSVLAATPRSAEARLHIGLASAAQAILEGVDRLGVDLVVTGTVSRGGIAGLLVGNTAERLIDRLDCALVALKPEDFHCPIEPESA